MKNCIGAFLMFAALSMANPAVAAEGDAGNWRLGVTLASKHFFNTPEDLALNDFCEENPGFEVEYQLADTVFVSAGRYRNSVCGRSTFISIGKELESGEVLGVMMRTGIEIGAADGYERLIEANDSVPTVGGNALMGGGYVRLGDTHSVKIRYMIVLMAASYQYQF